MAPTYSVIFSIDAQNQLDKILDYYLEEHSLDLAVEIQNRLLDAIEKAAEMPRAYSLETKFNSASNRIYRKVTAKNYSLVYSVIESVNEIIVVRVYHVRIGPNFFKEDLP